MLVWRKHPPNTTTANADSGGILLLKILGRWAQVGRHPTFFRGVFEAQEPCFHGCSHRSVEILFRLLLPRQISGHKFVLACVFLAGVQQKSGGFSTSRQRRESFLSGARTRGGSPSKLFIYLFVFFLERSPKVSFLSGFVQLQLTPPVSSGKKRKISFMIRTDSRSESVSLRRPKLPETGRTPKENSPQMKRGRLSPPSGSNL